jgi:chemotaxis receptor (MCP) glutamine deamidase CheD
MRNLEVQKDIDKSANLKMLKVGEVLILKTNEDFVWTVLGSCVSVIFHVPKRISLICHAQMPTQSKYKYNCFDSCPHTCFDSMQGSSDFKYVTCSIEYMIHQLVKNKISLKSIHTTILGGATGFFGIENDNSVGYQNIMAAKKILCKYKIRINRELTGGNEGITIWYCSSNNRLLVNKHKEEGKFELQDIKVQSRVI